MSDSIIVQCPNCGTKNRVPVEKMSLGPKCGRCKAPLPVPSSQGPVILTDANFDATISSAPTALVDCWAPWCGPCRMIGPVIEELAKEFAGRALIGKLNVDENPMVAQRYQIRSIPTLLFFKNGQLSDTIVGAVPPDQIRAKLLSLL
ncbi:MAG: thioredoxin [Thermodesulfobacteria bacterium]|nr:thioredoxin [Thermodesulfobacteriota bacterium]